MRRNPAIKTGFTLIELSIVLVIIGLIVGGVLVGQDLIRSSEVRATLTQVEKYNAAANTFRGKYNGLPGDLALAPATQLGFQVTGCSGGQAQRDGNGLLDGYASPNILIQGTNEVALFWTDLSSASLIDSTFPSGGMNFAPCNNIVSSLTTTPGPTYVGDIFPAAKMGRGLFFYVYETGGYNWYGLSAVTAVNSSSGALSSNAVIPVLQAYQIDKKMDDGLPTTGNVMAAFINVNTTATTTANAQAADSGTSCYNTSGNTYSISSAANGGTGANCALSFRFQ